jgi:sialate O-acetylesterase
MYKTIVFAAAILLFPVFCIGDPNICPIKCDFWVLAGQSNMQGYGRLPAKCETDANIIMLNMDNTWIPAQDPLHRLYASKAAIHRSLMHPGCTKEEFEALRTKHPNGSESGVGPGYFFAKHLVENGVGAIGLIPSAHGGTSMERWSPALKDKGDDSLYGAMMNRIQFAGGKIKGILWYQGENECDPKLCDNYEGQTLNLIDSIRRDVNDPCLPFIYVQIARLRFNGLGEGNARAWEKVRESQRRIMSLRPNVYMVATGDLPLDDLVHISCEGQQRLGRRLGEMALTYVYKKPGHAKMIDIESIEAFNNAKPKPYIKVKFKGVSGKLLSQGRAADFDFVSSKPIEGMTVPYRTDFDPNDPAAILIRVQKPVTSDIKLIYGAGLNPYVNIVDEKDMPVPAFGPCDIIVH